MFILINIENLWNPEVFNTHSKELYAFFILWKPLNIEVRLFLLLDRIVSLLLIYNIRKISTFTHLSRDRIWAVRGARISETR
jgi:hypothetical protein